MISTTRPLTNNALYTTGLQTSPAQGMPVGGPINLPMQPVGPQPIPTNLSPPPPTILPTTLLPPNRGQRLPGTEGKGAIRLQGRRDRRIPAPRTRGGWLTP